MKPSWTLRRYREGDEHAIVELARRFPAFGTGYTLDYWNWKYKRNPAGSSIIWLAERDGQIIGHYSLVPVLLKVGNAYVRGAFGSDAATHPNHQGQGVYSDLVNRCSLDAADHDIPISYGLSQVNLGPTYKRYERIGHICFMTHLIKVLDWKAALDRYIENEFAKSAISSILRMILRPRTPPSHNMQIEEVSRFDDRVDEFWTEISERFTVIVRRDQKYLNWRYVDHPGQKYTVYAAVNGHRVLGYCAVRIGTARGRRREKVLSVAFIDDILALDCEIVGSLVRSTVSRFEEQGVDAIACTMSQGHAYRAAFMKAGFVTFLRRFSDINLALYAAVNLPGTSIDQERAYSQSLILSQSHFLKERRNWFLMSGDNL